MGAAFRHVTMGNIPVLHEVQCSFGSLGDVITGKPAAARQRWHTYAEESFFGSGIYAAVEASRGDRERARELGKGMGRATGKIICGGGVLRDLPVLHELATCGESLGDMIGGGDEISAAKRWTSYAEGLVEPHPNPNPNRPQRLLSAAASTRQWRLTTVTIPERS